MRSYQWVCVKAAGESAVYCLVRSTAPVLNAFGANSAPGASGGGSCCGGDGP